MIDRIESCNFEAGAAPAGISAGVCRDEYKGKQVPPVSKGAQVPDGWRVSVVDYGNRTGEATISGPGVFCMQIPVAYSMLDFMQALAAATSPVQQVTDGGRNTRYEGLFDGETEEQRASRLASLQVCVPEGLADRIDSAITAFTSGRASMHVPVRPDDVDIVLAECLKLVKSLAAAPSAPAAQDGWIPVSERLPEPEVDVLVRYIRNNAIKHCAAALFNDVWSSQESEDMLIGEPTHWMPLPAAPEVKL